MCKTIVCSDVFTGLLISIWTIKTIIVSCAHRGCSSRDGVDKKKSSGITVHWVNTMFNVLMAHVVAWMICVINSCSSFSTKIWGVATERYGVKFQVQTSFHIVWATSGYNLYFCNIKPSNYWLTVVYLTYFYNRKCGDINIIHEKHISNNYIRGNQSFQEEIYEIIEYILHYAHLPPQSPYAARTILYISIFIITDSLWIMSAFLLFAGTCFHVKNYLSLLFYVPWILLTAFISLVDVVAAVHYGLDMLDIDDYTSWLRFIGVENYRDFSYLDAYKSSSFIPVGPVISLFLLFSRLVIFWVLNIVNMFQIATLAELAFQNKLDKSRNRYRRHRPRIHKDTHFKSVESRIKSWQQFYGSSETSSKASTPSLESMENVHVPTSRKEPKIEESHTMSTM